MIFRADNNFRLHHLKKDLFVSRDETCAPVSQQRRTILRRAKCFKGMTQIRNDVVDSDGYNKLTVVIFFSVHFKVVLIYQKRWSSVILSESSGPIVNDSPSPSEPSRNFDDDISFILRRKPSMDIFRDLTRVCFTERTGVLQKDRSVAADKGRNQYWRSL